MSETGQGAVHQFEILNKTCIPVVVEESLGFRKTEIEKLSHQAGNTQQPNTMVG